MIDWFPWVDHDGQGRPVPLGTYVRVIAQRSDGERVQAEAYAEEDLGWDWNNYGKEFAAGDDGTSGRAGRILRYRVRRWQAGEDLKRMTTEIFQRAVSYTCTAGGLPALRITKWDEGDDT